MKNFLRSGLTVFLCFGFLNCNLNIKSTLSRGEKEGYTIFYVSKAFCEQNHMEPVEFSVEYPDYLLTDIAEPQYENYNYNAFFKWNEEEVQTEGISIAECYLDSDYFEASDEEKEKRSEEYWQQIIRDYSQVFRFSTIETGKREFDGKSYFMFRAYADIENPEPDAEFKGKYMLQTLIVEPPDPGDNGLVITFLANEESEIKTFDDFATKGPISAVWRSLKFE